MDETLVEVVLDAIAFLRELQDLQDHFLAASTTSAAHPHSTGGCCVCVCQQVQGLCSLMHETTLILLEHTYGHTIASSPSISLVHGLLRVLRDCVHNLQSFLLEHILNKSYNARKNDRISNQDSEDLLTDVEVLQQTSQQRPLTEDVAESDIEVELAASDDEEPDAFAATPRQREQHRYAKGKKDVLSHLVKECNNAICFMQLLTQQIAHLLADINSTTSTTTTCFSRNNKKQRITRIIPEVENIPNLVTFVQDGIRKCQLNSTLSLESLLNTFLPMGNKNSISSGDYSHGLIVQLFWIKYFVKLDKMITFQEWVDCFEVEYGVQSRDAMWTLLQQLTTASSLGNHHHHHSDSSHQIFQQVYISIQDIIHWMKEASFSSTSPCISLIATFQQHCFSSTMLLLSGKCGPLTYARPTAISQFIGVPIRQVACGSHHIAVLSSCGELFTWGTGSFGRLGHGVVEDAMFPTKVMAFHRTAIERVACGFAATYAISTKGQVYSWGSGANGRLGTGDWTDHHRPCALTTLEDIRATDISAGSVHVCILDNQGKVYSAGKAGFCGHGTGQDSLLPLWLDCFDGERIQQISTSLCGFHSLVLTSSGNLYSWGHARVGQVGVSVIDESLRSDDGGKMLPIPHLVTENVPKNIAKIQAGWGHSCILTTTGDVYMCGRNVEGQLGINISYPGNTLRFNERNHLYQPTFLPIHAGDLNLGSATQCRKVKDIVCGGEHTLLLLESDLEVIGMGSCRDGQLFLTNSTQFDFQTLPIPTMLSFFQQEKRSIIQMAGGYSYTGCVVSVLRQPPSLKKLCSNAILQCPELTEFLFPRSEAEVDDASANAGYREMVLAHLC